jgi:2-iminoacetate synthase
MHGQGVVASAEEVRRQNFGSALRLHSVIYPIDFCTSGCTYCGLSSLLARERAHGARGRMRAETFDFVMRSLVDLGYHVHELVFGTVVEDQSRLADLVAGWVELARQRDPEGYLIVNCDTLQPEGYQRLRDAGTDAVWTFMETMTPENYHAKHRFGLKSDMAQRLEAPHRIRGAGMAVGNALLWGLSTDWEGEFEKFVGWSHEVGGFDFVATPVQQRLTLPVNAQAPANFDIEPPMVVSQELYQRICGELRLAFPNSHLVANTRLDPTFVYGQISRITDMSNGYVWTGSVSHPRQRLADDGHVKSDSAQMDFYNPGADPDVIQQMCPDDIVVRLDLARSPAAGVE